jgi:hypothetical protein
MLPYHTLIDIAVNLPSAQVVLETSMTPVGQAQENPGGFGESKQRCEQPPLLGSHGLLPGGCRLASKT